MITQSIAISMFCATGVLNSLFLSFYLFKSKNKNISNRLLGGIFVAITIKLGYLFFNYIGIESNTLKVLYVKLSVASYLSLGPLFLLYIISVKMDPFHFQPKYIVHFIPSILYLIIYECFLDYYFWAYGGFYVIQLFFLAYLIISLFQILKIHTENKSIKSDFNISNWLIYLFAGIFIIWTSVFFKRYNYFPELVAFFSFALYILLYVFFGNLTSINKKIRKHKDDYCKFNISNTIQRIDELMSKKKPYLDFDFSLTGMSEILDIPIHVLSYILNNYYNNNFREFINNFRIKDIKEKLTNEKNSDKTIQSLAFESGFNSLSVFNTEFKKATKKTPTEYRKVL